MKTGAAPKPFSGTSVLLLDCHTVQSLPLLEAYHRLGAAVGTVSRSRFDPGAVSRYRARRHIIPVRAFQQQEYLAGLTGILEEQHYDLVIPLTDSTARLLAKNREALSRYARIAVEGGEVFDRIDDKQRTMLVCQENGIPCPRTYSVSDDVDEIARAVDAYPAAMKPRYGYGAVGFRRLDSEEELRRYYPEAVREFGPMLVEEYIPQTGTQYTCDVYIGRDRQVKSAVIYGKPRWYPVGGGASCCNVTVDRPDLIADCVKLLEKLGWTGYADLDLIEDPRDGSVRIMEINPRIAATAKIAFLAGIDVARQILEDALGMPVTVYTDYRKNVVTRRFLVDCAWFVKSPRRFKTKPNWFNPFFHGQVFSAADPLPALAYLLKPLFRHAAAKGTPGL